MVAACGIGAAGQVVSPGTGTAVAGIQQRKFNWGRFCLALQSTVCGEIFGYFPLQYMTKLYVTQSCVTASSVKYSKINPNFPNSVHRLIKHRWTKECAASLKVELTRHRSTSSLTLLQKDMLTVPRWSDARGQLAGSGGGKYIAERQKRGNKRFNSKEWRLCFSHLGLINLYYRYTVYKNIWGSKQLYLLYIK